MEEREYVAGEEADNGGLKHANDQRLSRNYPKSDYLVEILELCLIHWGRQRSWFV